MNFKCKNCNSSIEMYFLFQYSPFLSPFLKKAIKKEDIGELIKETDVIYLIVKKESCKCKNATLVDDDVLILKDWKFEIIYVGGENV